MVLVFNINQVNVFINVCVLYISFVSESVCVNLISDVEPDITNFLQLFSLFLKNSF